MKSSQLSQIGKRLFEVIEFDENEKLIAEIRKHPFGLYLIYLTGIFVAVVLLIIFLILSIVVTTEGSDAEGLRGLLVIAGAGIALVVLGITFVAGYLYNSNVIILTNEKLAQVLYKSLFNRKISQLSIGDVQDVTVSQNGVFARYFNYGTLIVETAGEQQNYTFSYATNPYESAKQIVGAHELNLKEYGN